ncbi:hypothetical protein VTK26DRAFT_5946 [Humicola hyalothermophila]
MEAAGLAAGMVSLALDVFDGTVRIFKFLTALVDMPRECEKYRLQLIMEYNRVLAWGKAAGLVEIPEGSTLAITLGTESIELVAIVARIQWLLTEFRDLNSRYNNEIREVEKGNHPIMDTRSANIDILKEISSLAVSYEAKKKERRRLKGTNHLREFLEKAGRNTKEILAHPVRIRWVAVDKEAFEELLTDLHALTERLHELMRTYREKRIDDITTKTYREMILARNDIQDLKDMFDAVNGLISTTCTSQGKGRATHSNKTLQDLIQLKRISRASETILSQLRIDKTLDISQLLTDLGITVRQYSSDDLFSSFEWNEPDNGCPELLPRPRGFLSLASASASPSDSPQPEKPAPTIPVWIEWKSLDTDAPPNSLRAKESLLRTVALAQMLALPKPATLQAPECVGFFDDSDVSGAGRFGWLFRMPEGDDGDARVVPLHDLLGNARFRPNLSQRVGMARRLCETVLDLHAVNWLHKGIFGDNVLFVFRGRGEAGAEEAATWLGYDPESPLLSGFEFSRPDGTHTTARDVDVVWDLYRWPEIQRQRPTERNSKKTYDLYSLGLLLLEIAHWERLDRLMRFGRRMDKEGTDRREVPDVSLEESKKVRDWLLGAQGGAPFHAAGAPNPLRELRNIVGDRYWRAVERCLWAHGEKGLGVEETADQSNDSRIGILLQEAFTEHVVEELRSVDV